jgi:hypothetical protein
MTCGTSPPCHPLLTTCTRTHHQTKKTQTQPLLLGKHTMTQFHLNEEAMSGALQFFSLTDHVYLSTMTTICCSASLGQIKYPKTHALRKDWRVQSAFVPEPNCILRGAYGVLSVKSCSISCETVRSNTGRNTRNTAVSTGSVWWERRVTDALGFSASETVIFQDIV